MTTSLNDWLERINQHHPAEVELGLERCQKVFQRIFSDAWRLPVITVAGTNGKGSTIAYLDALARAANKNVLTFTSPHLFDYRERLTHNGDWLTEAQHIEAFQVIETAADSIPLTYFEFSTLSAFYLAVQLNVDVLLLEVGLGGRLDATNLVPADVAVITTVDLDHQAYLGDTIEAIAREKLGIIHAKTKAVIADNTIPTHLLNSLECRELIQWNSDYAITNGVLSIPDQAVSELVLPEQIQPSTNSAAACVAFGALFGFEQLPKWVEVAKQRLTLRGRLQKINDSPPVLLDVAHNPQAFKHLVNVLQKRNLTPCHLVLGMLEDKQVEDCLVILKDVVTHWHLCVPDSERACETERLQQALNAMGIPQSAVTCYASVQRAYEGALLASTDMNETLLVTGSFFTVGPVLQREVINV